MSERSWKSGLRLGLEYRLADDLSIEAKYFGLQQWCREATFRVVANFYQILDLTNGKVRTRIRLSLDRMLKEKWWEKATADEEAITQALGRVAQATGLEGLLVPSAARRGGRGLVYFPQNKDSRSSLAIVNADQLPNRAY